MFIVRPRRRRVPTVLTDGSSSRPMNLFPNERSRSIFALLDGYDDRSDNGPPPSLDSHMEMNTDDVPVVNVQDSSDGEGTGEAASRPGYCKICSMESKKVKTHGEASNQIRKETPLKCVICFSATTDGGTHHPHAMRCGHIFGKRCIDPWIGAKMPSTCPVCTQVSQDSMLIHLFVTSAIPDMLENALEKADGVNQLKMKHRAEKATLIGLNTMLFKCVKNYVEALEMGCGMSPDP